MVEFPVISFLFFLSVFSTINMYSLYNKEKNKCYFSIKGNLGWLSHKFNFPNKSALVDMPTLKVNKNKSSTT